jgi:hypothetical protein
MHAVAFGDHLSGVHTGWPRLAEVRSRASVYGFVPRRSQLRFGANFERTSKLMMVKVLHGNSGEPGRTRTSNPLIKRPSKRNCD